MHARSHTLRDARARTPESFVSARIDDAEQWLQNEVLGARMRARYHTSYRCANAYAYDLADRQCQVALHSWTNTTSGQHYLGPILPRANIT